jgi:FecR protein
MKTLVVSIVALSLAGSVVAQLTTPLDYRFEQVKHNVQLTGLATKAHAVAQGQHATSGDKVTTGWFSYALIASDRHKAKFEIFSSTDVHLASGTPGVILSLDRGRLRAMFDKITGNEPRVVETPGALLAVRGTQYDVEVDDAGRTTLDVWEGTVELRSAKLKEPILVHAGEESAFGRHDVPTARPMPEDRRKNGPPAREGERNVPPNDGGQRGAPRNGEPGDHGQPGSGQQPPLLPHGTSRKPPGESD